MKFWVGVTDKDWFDYLSKIIPDEVNFWRPHEIGFHAIESGSLFLFKLRKPLNKIVGGGYFVRSEKVPLSLAWQAFGEKNGAASFNELRNLINGHLAIPKLNPIIGCIILNQPFFFSKDKWIDSPGDWPYNIPGKTYDVQSYEGEKLYRAVYEMLQIINRPIEQIPLFGESYLSKTRLGQGTFKILVSSAYKMRCAITGEKTLPVLQAAHIKPVCLNGPNNVSNGIFLRSDFHLLFDSGYLTITPQFEVVISKRIHDEYKNGQHYYAFHGKKLISLPVNGFEKPDISFLRWHNDEIYRD